MGSGVRAAQGLDQRLPAEAYVLALSSVPGAGPAWVRSVLLDSPPELAWRQVVEGAVRPPGPRAQGRSGTALRRPAYPDPGVLWARCLALEVDVVWPGGRGRQDGTPDWLALCWPLFAKGSVGALGGPAVALVGTRRCTPDGRATAYELARDLVAAGITVVSGLALGIDAAAHSGALSVRARGQVPTVAVAASGVDVVYPSEYSGDSVHPVRCFRTPWSQVPERQAAWP